MSIKVMDMVWKSDLPHNEKFVLLCLADWSNDEGESIYPSVSHIAWKTGYSARNVKELLAILKEKGILSWDSRASKYGTNLYVIDLDRLPTRPAFNSAKIALPMVRKSPQDGAKTAQNPLDTLVEPLDSLGEEKSPEFQEESPEEYFERTHPKPQMLEVSPITADNYKERIGAAIQEGIDRTNGKNIPVENYLVKLPEHIRPVARAFLDLWGSPPLTSAEDKRWRSEFYLIHESHIQPEFITRAYKDMLARNLTIKSPGSVRAIALSMQKATNITEGMSEYDKLCAQYQDSPYTSMTDSSGKLLWARGWSADQVNAYNCEHASSL